MTSRERILSAIAHREPDGVPVDLGSTPSSGISAIAYGNLKRHLGITSGHNRVYDLVQQLAQPEDEILNRFGIDVVDVARTFDTSDSDWHDLTLFDGSTAQYPQWFHPMATPEGGWRSSAPDGTEIAITFWDGGADTRKVLNHGTPQEVRDDVRRRIDILAPGGGFVFNAIHNVLADVPPENIVAMFEAVAEYGGEA